MGKQTLELIDRVLETRQGTGFRNHLGASVIGKACVRQIWYIFRWANVSHFSGRLLRLFDRGNREEEAIAKFLRQAGVHVETEDPLTGHQRRIEDHGGHFGGSLDARLFDAPDFPGIWILGEFKTHNDKSFKNLLKRGLKEAKIEYFVQAQIYMRYEELPACLHFNVNKNTDEMEILTVEFDPSEAERYIERAGKIIFSPTPPPRIQNASPGWFICRWCDYRDICHHHKPKARNCRTCRWVRPTDDGHWVCTQFSNYVLGRREQELGCQAYEEILEE